MDNNWGDRGVNESNANGDGGKSAIENSHLTHQGAVVSWGWMHGNEYAGIGVRTQAEVTSSLAEVTGNGND